MWSGQAAVCAKRNCIAWCHWSRGLHKTVGCVRLSMILNTQQMNIWMHGAKNPLRKRANPPIEPGLSSMSRNTT